jgi:hypothetical protein
MAKQISNRYSQNEGKKINYNTADPLISKDQGHMFPKIGKERKIATPQIFSSVKGNVYYIGSP